MSVNHSSIGITISPTLTITGFNMLLPIDFRRHRTASGRAMDGVVDENEIGEVGWLESKSDGRVKVTGEQVDRIAKVTGD